MTSHINTKFKKSYKKLPDEIKMVAKKQFRIFQRDPYHTSLHFKRVHSTKPIYSARITQNYRTLGIVKGDVIIWFWIGSHNDYDRLLKIS